MRGNALNHPKPDPSSVKHPGAQWRLMSAYERFEQLVVIALSLIIAVVILIALLQLCRKFVILDTLTTPALTIAALGFATLVLGVVCWLLGKRDLSAQD